MEYVKHFEKLGLEPPEIDKQFVPDADFDLSKAYSSACEKNYDNYRRAADDLNTAFSAAQKALIDAHKQSRNTNDSAKLNDPRSPQDEGSQNAATPFSNTPFKNKPEPD